MWFELILGTAFVVLYAALLGLAFARSRKAHSSGNRSLPRHHRKATTPEKGVQAFTTRLRAWAEADDGKSVYMFNLINFFPKLQTFHGAPEFKGTPEQANAHYERSLMWLWLSHASYPTFIGVPQVRNLVNMEPEREDLGKCDCRALP